MDQKLAPSETLAADAPAALPTPRNRRRIIEHEVQDENVPYSAASRSRPERLDNALKHAILCARIADDNRAKNILLLDVRKATPLVDYLVIATASSRRQSNAIAVEIDAEMKKIHELKLGIEGAEEGRWVLIDYGDFIVHVFNDEARAYYSLEDIWGDADQIEWRDPLRPSSVTRVSSLSSDSDE